MEANLDLKSTLDNLNVHCDNIEYAFSTIKDDAELEKEDVLGTFKEKEGLSVIAKKRYLESNKLPYHGVFAKLNIGISTSLELVGLTAVLSNLLAQENIPTNVVSAYYHDHIFVPYALKDKAINTLGQLRTKHGN